MNSGVRVRRRTFEKEGKPGDFVGGGLWTWIGSWYGTIMTARGALGRMKGAPTASTRWRTRNTCGRARLESCQRHHPGPVRPWIRGVKAPGGKRGLDSIKLATSTD